MYFLDTLALAKDLSNGLVSEKESFKYLFVLMILTGFTVPSFTPGEIDISPYDAFEYLGSTIASIAFFYFTLLSCFRLNSEYDSRDFVKRFVCLTLPVTIRLMIVIFVGVIFSILLNSIADPFVVKILFYISALCTVGLWYYWIVQAFAAITLEPHDKIE